MTQAATDVSKSSAYQDKLMGVLGDRDPIEVLQATPQVFAQIVRENPAGVMQTRPYMDKWTPCEIIGHLIDTEWVFGFRKRLIYSETEPTIIGMDQDLWVAAQQYNRRAPLELVDQFGQLRAINLQLEKQLSTADLGRCGKHSERGKESLGLMRKMHAGHDLVHIDQLKRYVAAVKAGMRAEIDRGPAVAR